MKLNMDCVRAVMLCVEEHTDFDHYCFFIHYSKAKTLDILGQDPIDPPAYQVELESKFDNDDILYSIKYCVESGLIVLNPGSTIGEYRVNVKDITASGHNFLENVRDDKTWKKIKQVAIKASALSLDVVMGIAKDVAVSLAKQAVSSI